MHSSYSKIEPAKDGNPVPVCISPVSGSEIFLHSKYNPVREAEGFASNADSSALFFIVLGLAGAYHIKALLEKCPESKIIAVENTEEDIDFLSQIPCVKKLLSDKRVVATAICDIEKAILSTYRPALHGNLTILSLRQWESVFQENAEICRQKINGAIKLLAADFSVQSHFGKIWQKNIITNLSLAEKTKNFEEIKQKYASFSAQGKKAAIIAAGPSLDESVEILKKERESYFIIATDTAFSSLLKRGIKSDAVVSIDGQAVSHEHYMEVLPADTLYVFDLCAASSSVRKALRFSENVILAETGHPLSQYASLYSGKRNFVHLEAGSGTVTIAAASLAQKLGFSTGQIEFFGADFSYTGGRPYTKGTYLESKFYSKSDRFSTAEKAYTALMYRTPVIKLSENQITTEILNAYKDSLADFMARMKNESENEAVDGSFILEDFKSKYCKELKTSFRSEKDFDENSYAMMTLIPLCAKLGKGSAFLAYLKTLSYTERV